MRWWKIYSANKKQFNCVRVKKIKINKIFVKTSSNAVEGAHSLCRSRPVAAYHGKGDDFMKQMVKDLRAADKFAVNWLMDETKRIVQEKGTFKNSEHSKTWAELVAEEMVKMGYSKNGADAERLNMAVDMLNYEMAIKDEHIARLEREKQALTEKVVKAALTEVLGYCACDEVGMKYLIKRTAKKYGVEL